MEADALAPYGWDEDWAERFAPFDDGTAEAARVVRHDGAGLIVATERGTEAVPLVERVVPPPAVGDWVVLRDGRPAGVLERSSLLRRRDERTESQQVLAANVDLVLLVCGLDRPVKEGRIQRGVAVAREAGAEPVVVLTKALGADATIGVDEAMAIARHAHPGIAVVVTSVKEGMGVDDLESFVAGRTVVLLGESGAGKSSLVNALLRDDRAAEGRVRAGDAKGRHTTTSRSLYVLPTGGTLIDTPGIRSVGLWVDEDSTAVAETFADIDELAGGCRFSDCAHETEPGCAVREAVEAGHLDEDRLLRWRLLEVEAQAAAVRASPHERRRHEKKLARLVKEAQRRKEQP